MTETIRRTVTHSRQNSPARAINPPFAQMSRTKFGCAIVCRDDGKVVGIFTTVDAIKILGFVLKEMAKDDSSIDDVFKVLHEKEIPPWLT